MSDWKLGGDLDMDGERDDTIQLIRGNKLTPHINEQKLLIDFNDDGKIDHTITHWNEVGPGWFERNETGILGAVGVVGITLPLLAVVGVLAFFAYEAWGNQKLQEIEDARSKLRSGSRY